MKSFSNSGEVMRVQRARETESSNCYGPAKARWQLTVQLSARIDVQTITLLRQLGEVCA